MKAIAPIFVSILILSSSAGARGEWFGGKDRVAAQKPLLYANGCYWHRGVRYCSSYCYVEINGKRYCNTRESEAFPQGDPYAAVRPTVQEIYRRPRGDGYR